MTEPPPALAERRAELHRRIDADNEAAEHLRDKIKEVLHNRDDARAELRGIDAAIEAFEGVVLNQVADTAYDEMPLNKTRRPRRDIRAMVKEIRANPAASGMTAEGIAREIGCRVSQVEAALRLIPKHEKVTTTVDSSLANGGEE